jgi:zinc/manganese transport system substrate-binding protein
MRPLLFTLLLLLGPAMTTARAELRVVATVPDLAALAKEIGGDRAQVTALALHTQDPHFVDAKPSLVLELNKANLLLAIGLELEAGWLPTLQTGARNGAIQIGSPGFLDCSTLVRLLEVPQQKIERSQGDIHPGGNPHYLYDPRAAAAVVAGIARRMGELDPAHAAEYEKNAAALRGRLEAARAGWEQRLAALRGAPVVTYHKSWVYFIDWVGLVEVAQLEPKPGIPPSPSHVARVLGLARQRGVKLVLIEDYYPDDTARLVASKIPAALARLPGGANFREGQTYLQRMDALVAAVEKAVAP